MLINLSEILRPAKEHGFAVGAFNVTESTMFKAIVETAEALNAPTIIQVAPNEVEFSDAEQYEYFVARLRNSKTPFALHYDHGKSLGGCLQAIRCGFTSVMFDGSHLPYEENVRLTKQVVALAHPLGVSVEGEIGSIGELADYEAGTVKDMLYTTPEMAAQFAKDSGVDALAISIGTVHGVLPKGYIPDLRLDILGDVRKVVEIPLVLHGGSQTPDADISAACHQGINKANVSSEFKNAYFQKVVEFATQNATAVSPTLVLKGAVAEVKQIVGHKIQLFGANGKAHLYSDAQITRGGPTSNSVATD